MSLGVSQLNTNASEITYNDGSTTSELNWKNEDFYLIELDLQYLFFYRFILNANINTNFNENENTMTYDNISSSTKNDYDTTTKNVDLYDLNLKYLLFAKKSNLFFVQLGMKKNLYEWESKNTDGTNEISYEQDITSPYLGVGIISSLFNRIQLILNFNYSNKVEIEAFDIHHNTQYFGSDYTTYSDHFEDGILKETNLTLYYLLSKSLSLYFSYDDIKFETVKGYTDINYVGIDRSSTTADSTAGANNESTLYKTGLRYFF